MNVLTKNNLIKNYLNEISFFLKKNLGSKK
jgi:hypothetical protein